MRTMVSTTPPVDQDLWDNYNDDDVRGIQKALENLNIQASAVSIEQAWYDYSDTMFAGWINIGDNFEWAAIELIKGNFLKDE